MQQIADWLEKLGMSEYAQRFAENAIDFSVLSDLTDQDQRSSASCSAIVASCCVQLRASKASRKAHLLYPSRLLHERRKPPSAAK